MTTLEKPTQHIPVLEQEVVELMNIQPGGRYVDCTVGSGGHAEAILEASYPGGQLLGLDADADAIEVSRERLSHYDKGVHLLNANYEQLEAICDRHNFRPLHGILFDLGMSSCQLSAERRGFSFQREDPLDMRFDRKSGQITAADIVNTYPEAEIATILRTYGEERKNRLIARRIVAQRPISTTTQLATVVKDAVGNSGRIHPATKTFQALRIAVNQELDRIRCTLRQAINLLGVGGRVGVISYHSLEDRAVKEIMQRESKGCLCPLDVMECRCDHKPVIRIITHDVVVPSAQEARINPRCRSARLRVAERISRP